MFIRHFVRRNKDGSGRVYLCLCRNCMSGGKERQELVAKLGLVMSGDGLPVAHRVFPGNTADINAFRVALKNLR